jgi:hypothetical protein
MKRSAKLWNAAVLLMAAAAASGNVLFTNGSFETGDYTGWTPILTSNPLIQGVTGINTPPDGPEDGSKYAYFGNGIPIETFIYQTITTIPDDSYTITFWVSVDPIKNITEDPGSLFPYGIGMDVNFGPTVEDLTLSDAAFMPWTEFTLTAVAVSTSTIVEFTGWNDDGGMVFLDNITGVNNGAVPEPATFALAGAGLLMAGLWRKLKR